jgi:hypothetical protein
LILSETEDASQPTTNGINNNNANNTNNDKATWRWRVNNEIRRVEVPDPDEEQLPHSLRIAVERGGAVCSIACQTPEDLVNLRRGRRLLKVGVTDCSVGILFE